MNVCVPVRAQLRYPLLTPTSTLVLSNVALERTLNLLARASVRRVTQGRSRAQMELRGVPIV